MQMFSLMKLDDIVWFQYELVAELFADLDSEADAGKGRVQALQAGPKGGSKKMRKTVGSQVCISII